MKLEFRHRFFKRPRRIRSGEMACVYNSSLVEKREETALILGLITHRRLFGHVYCGLQPDYFDVMQQDSGVYICPVQPTEDVIPGVFNPGDIDILIIPYEQDNLILHRILAVEVKAIRASYLKQGRSPNEYGFSQATALRQMGFPYVAVMHLIMSDESPREAWREIGIAKVLDEFGRYKMLPNQKVDWLPIDLMKRSFGRLKSNATCRDFGLAAVYLGSRREDIIHVGLNRGIWLPDCERALYNERCCEHLLKKIAELFENKPWRFLDTPRFDPK